MLSLMFATIFCLMLSGCSDDDWANYEEKIEDVSIRLENSIYKFDECQEELKIICNKYAQNLLLVHAEYVFSKGSEDYAIISLSENYEKDNAGYTVLCELYVDIDKNTVTKIKYINGHSKRVSSYSRKLDNINGMRADELYANIMEELSRDKAKDVEKTQISYYNDRVNINCYDDKGENIYCASRS